MSDMKTEQLQPGQNPAGLAEGGQPTIGATHEVNAEVGGGAIYLRGLAEQAKVGGDLSGLGEEMGGGGEVDPVEKYFVDGQGNLEAMGKFIEAQRQAGLGDERQINVDDKPLCSFGEYQKAYEAIKVAQARGDRRPIEEIVREARQPAPRPPEPQSAPRSVDWRDNLPQDQRKRLEGFENRIIGFSDQELQLVESGIRETRAKALKDGWNHRSVQEGDADMCLRAIQEKLVGQNDLESILIENGLFNHVKLVQQREGLKDLQDTLMYLAGKLGHHDSLLENPPSDLFPSAAKLPNGEWDATGEKLAQFLRKLTTGNKPNNGG